MILRRLADAIRAQNWFTVIIEILIVVIGIFLGLQVTEWNDARKAKAEERLVLAQLEEEFIEIKSNLERQIFYRTHWIDYLSKLITTLEETAPPASDEEIKLALTATTAAGRQAPQSATFLQLMSSGGLAVLTDTGVRRALMRYDARLKRDAFIHESLVNFALEELSGNTFVDRNPLMYDRNTAGIDQDFDAYVEESIRQIRSYDLEALKQYETQYEASYRMQTLQLTAEETQLAFAEDILRQIAEGRTR